MNQREAKRRVNAWAATVLADANVREHFPAAGSADFNRLETSAAELVEELARRAGDPPRHQEVPGQRDLFEGEILDRTFLRDHEPVEPGSPVDRAYDDALRGHPIGPQP